MSRPIAVLRPEPGNRDTAAAIEARGKSAIRLPLFEVRAMPWEVPDASAFDALILTSANSLRFGGAGLDVLKPLPVHAVGAATARAAHAAGFAVVAVGDSGAAALTQAAERSGVTRALHLAGADRTVAEGGIVAAIRTVYASIARDLTAEAVAPLAGSVALLHSARAARRLAALLDRGGPARDSVALVALSDTVATAAGTGWEGVHVVPATDPAAMIDAAIALAD